MRFGELKIGFFFLLLVLGGSQCGKNPESVIFLSKNNGMFSVVGEGIAWLRAYDQGHIKGLEFDFGDTGLFYDTKHGPNWWSYYFEPIKLGQIDNNSVKTYSPNYNDKIKHPEMAGLSREEVHGLLQKYVHLKPSLQEKIDGYVKKHFEGHFVIGVHYRGTDKVSEAPVVDYGRVAETLRTQIAHIGDKDYRIFIATDEKRFLDYIQKQFPGKIFSMDGITRSSDGVAVHTSSDSNKYKLGEDAIVDCILLSKTNLLIRTSSNLSLFSTYFNPNIQVIELSQRL